MRAAAIAVLIAFLPSVVTGQNQAPQQQSSGKKLKWIGIGAAIGGAGLAAIALSGDGVSSRESTAGSFSCGNPGPTVVVIGCGSVVAAAVPFPGGSTGTGGTSPLTPPGVSAMNSVNTFGVSLPQQRMTNWKLLGPAIGVAGLGGFLFYEGHIRGKKAALSVAPEGGVRLQLRW
jgi:hypothetical protein